MAQQGAIELPGVNIPLSLSDRPVWYRALVQAWRFCVRKPLGGIGVLIIIIVSFAAITTPLIQRYDPELAFEVFRPNCTAAQSAEKPATTLCYDVELVKAIDDDPSIKLDSSRVSDPNRLISGKRVQFTEDPSSAHWLGTDLAGRDVYSRIINGSRLALVIGLGASLVAVVIGTTLGLISAYFGGLVDLIIQRLTDACQAFPPFILLLLVTQVVDKPSMFFLAFALGMVGISSVVRIVRGSVLATREEVYVLAARTIGAADSRIMGRHILPNIFSPIIVVFTSAIGAYILAEAGLAFVGLWDLGAISWGKMVEEGRRLGPAKPLMALFVGSALTVTVLGFNLAGDALRDVLDPRLRGRSGRAGF